VTPGEIAAAIGLLIWVLLFQAPLYSWINGDDGTYAVMARSIVSGHAPYIEVWDNKPIGTYVVFAIAESLFGFHLVAFKALYTIAILLTSATMFLFGRDILRSSRAGLLAAILYPAFTGNNDNTEIFILLSLVLGFYQFCLSLSAARERQPYFGRFLVSAFALGLALQFKYSAILEVGAVSIAGWIFMWRYLGIRPEKIAGLALLQGFAILTPTLIAAGAYAASGHLSVFLDANFLAPFHYVSQAAHITSLSSILHSAYCFVPLLGMAAAGTLIVGWRVWPRADDLQRLGLFVLVAWALGAAVSINLSSRYYQHYFLLIVPPLALLAGFSIAQIHVLGARPARRYWAAFGLSASILVLPIVHYVQESRWIAANATAPAEYRRLTQAIRSGIVAGDTIYVVNDNPMIYVLSGAGVPTRFAWPWHILRDDFGSAVDWKTEIASIFARAPRYIVLRDAGGMYADANSAERLAFIRDEMRGHYDRAGSSGSLTLFVRVPGLNPTP
jgi:4-amino-4-deoxy-L-arabinose transferase-like glycosyltransferase